MFLTLSMKIICWTLTFLYPINAELLGEGRWKGTLIIFVTGVPIFGHLFVELLTCVLPPSEQNLPV